MNSQLDLPRYGGYYFMLPTTVPGRISYDDFVYFTFPESIDRTLYDVVIESMDTSGPRFRKIGKLEGKVQLPAVMLPADGKLALLPVDKRLPSFGAQCRRGGMYIVQDPRPVSKNQQGQHIQTAMPGMFPMIVRGQYM